MISNQKLIKYNIIIKQLSLFILITFYSSCVSNTQTEKDKIDCELTTIAFKKKVYDFGKIAAQKSVSTDFEFSNTGETSLLIKNVNTSCDCTVPEWDKGIIKPDGKGEIKIVYDTKSPGRFNKTVMVFYNGKNSPEILSIKGEVIYPETDDEEANIK